MATKITGEIRTGGKATKLREAGKVPAVMYGGGIDAPVSVSFDGKEFKKAWHAAGASSPITVVLPEGDQDCIIHALDRDPVSDEIIHADLLALDKNKKVEVKVELEFIGVSPAVKSNAGVLEKMVHEIEIEALPRNLPKSIEVDISVLAELGNQITVGDLKLPEGVTAKTDATEIIALITAIKEEKEEVAEPIDFTKIEISDQKGKKPEEAEVGAEGEGENKE